jgi:predicted DNA-binding ribbon-helix-helix protein
LNKTRRGRHATIAAGQLAIAESEPVSAAQCVLRDTRLAMWRGRRIEAVVVTAEDAFWDALEDVASDRRMNLNVLIREVDRQRPAQLSLADALRITAVDHFRRRRTEAASR